MASLSNPLLLQKATAGYATTNYERCPGKKRFWRSDGVEKTPDAELYLKADPKSLLSEIALRELLPIVAIIGFVVTHLNSTCHTLKRLTMGHLVRYISAQAGKCLTLTIPQSSVSM
jgi:hypothetical protein